MIFMVPNPLQIRSESLQEQFASNLGAAVQKTQTEEDFYFDSDDRSYGAPAEER